MRDVIISLTIILVATFLFIDTFSIKETNNAIGPANWPQLLLLFLVTFGLVMLSQSIKKLNLKMPSSNEETNLIRFWLLLSISLLYIPATLYLGFLTATPLVLALLAYSMGMRHPILLIAFPLLSTLLVTYIFIILLQVSMPRGTGFLREFSLLFY